MYISEGNSSCTDERLGQNCSTIVPDEEDGDVWIHIGAPVVVIIVLGVVGAFVCALWYQRRRNRQPDDDDSSIQHPTTSNQRRRMPESITEHQSANVGLRRGTPERNTEHLRSPHNLQSRVPILTPAIGSSAYYGLPQSQPDIRPIYVINNNYVYGPTTVQQIENETGFSSVTDVRGRQINGSSRQVTTQISVEDSGIEGSTFLNAIEPIEPSEQGVYETLHQAVQCCICREEDAKLLCVPCSHVCMCRNCCQQYVTGGNMTCPICQTGIERFNEVFYHQPDNSNINEHTGTAIINELLDQQYAERLQREINAGDLGTSNSHIVNDNAESILDQVLNQYDLDNQQRRRQGRRQGNTENEGVQCCICMEGEVRIMCVPCNHLCMCRNCYERYTREGNTICPQCRAGIERITEVFF